MADNMKLVTKEYVDTGLTSKVNKEDGKGLSTNDFTNEDKEKLYSALQKENIDQTYNSTSENAQSGIAVAEAFERKTTLFMPIFNILSGKPRINEYNLLTQFPCSRNME